MAHYGMESITWFYNHANRRVDFVHGWHVPYMRSSLPLNFAAVMEYSAKPCWVVWTFRAMPTYPLIYLNLSRCFNAVVKWSNMYYSTFVYCYHLLYFWKKTNLLFPEKTMQEIFFYFYLRSVSTEAFFTKCFFMLSHFFDVV